MKKISKTEAEKKIVDFFSSLKGKNSKDVKKIKTLAMSQGIKLGNKRKLFCKKCLALYSGKEIVRISKGIKSIRCLNCSFVSRWKIKKN